MKDVEVINIEDKKYAILNEVTDDNITYVYLSNVDNPDDILIRKSSEEDKDLYIPLDNEDEFYLATLLLFKGDKKSE